MKTEIKPPLPPRISYFNFDNSPAGLCSIRKKPQRIKANKKGEEIYECQFKCWYVLAKVLYLIKKGTPSDIIFEIVWDLYDTQREHVSHATFENDSTPPKQD